MLRICEVAYTNYISDPRVRREAEALAEQGHQVDMISCASKDLESGKIIRNVRNLPSLIKKYNGHNPFFYFCSYLLFFIHVGIKVAFLHMRYRYHLIHVHTMPDFLVFTALFPKLFGAKVILDMHDMVPELYISKFGINKDNFIIRVLTWIESRSVALAHLCLSVHIPHRDLTVSHGNPIEKFSVLMNVPDPAIFNVKSELLIERDDKFRLIYHGTISRRHGLDTAIKAVDIVRKSIPEIELCIIGPGDDIERLKELVTSLDLSEYITFSSGALRLEEIPEKILQSDIGIITISNDIFTRYMLPVKLMEYVKMGIPVITSRTSTIEHYFNEEMVAYIEAGNHEQMAVKIVDLYNHPKKRKNMIQAANQFNDNYNWESQKIHFLDLVNNLANSRR